MPHKKRNYKLSFKAKLFLIIGIFIIIFLLLLNCFNHDIKPQLNAFAKQQVGFATNQVIQKVIPKMDYVSEDLMDIELNDQNEITSINYNTKKLNQILRDALFRIEQSLLAAQSGELDPSLEQVLYEEGIIYQAPIGSFTHLFFLYDKGFPVKVRMRLLNDVKGEVKTSSQSYGINSTLIKIELAINVEMAVINFAGTTQMRTKTALPLVLQVVNGKVPSFTPFTNQDN